MKKSWPPLSLWNQILDGTKRLGKGGWTDRRSTSPHHSIVDQPQSPTTASATRTPKVGSVAIVVPIYNAQAQLQQTFAAILQHLATHPTHQFILVNDGSTDQSKALLENWIKLSQTRQVHLLSYSPRVGKGYAIRRGIEYAESAYICYLDVDLAHTLDQLDLLVEQLQVFDLVIGARSPEAEKINRLGWRHKIARKLVNRLSRSLLNVQYRDRQISLKGFKQSVAKTLFAQQNLTEGAFELELIYLAQQGGYAIAEVPVLNSAAHQQPLSKVNLLQDSIKMLIDLLKVRLNDVMGRYQ
jgi:dolichyl-phosphate beta-glucosyltransferase